MFLAFLGGSACCLGKCRSAERLLIPPNAFSNVHQGGGPLFSLEQTRKRTVVQPAYFLQLASCSDIISVQFYSIDYDLLLMEQAGIAPEILDRVIGSVAGLGIGDAVGAALEGFKPPVQHPIDDMVGGK